MTSATRLLIRPLYLLCMHKTVLNGDIFQRTVMAGKCIISSRCKLIIQRYRERWKAPMTVMYVSLTLYEWNSSMALTTSNFLAMRNFTATSQERGGTEWKEVQEFISCRNRRVAWGPKYKKISKNIIEAREMSTVQCSDLQNCYSIYSIQKHN